ncbi:MULTISPECIES: RICIN domain-containing protein [Nocardiopsis]|uniref:RICIN domain-containing protein n=1 Tax=Nocardiopsis TaxID=2013 RepID=UPI00034543C4|nr:MULTISPECIES: RICIN domain-containing protein [Nocardiopsis]
MTASAAVLLSFVTAAVLGIALPASAAPAPPAQGTDYQIRFEPNEARMVPYAGAATRVDVRVWPADHRGMDWELTRTGSVDGHPTYEIRNLYSNLCLEPKNGLPAVGQRVEQTGCTGRDRQEWLLPYVDNAHQIVPVRNTRLGVTLENPAWNGSFLKLGYRSFADSGYRWAFEAL